MEKYHLMGIVVDRRKTQAPNVQEVLTKYGDIIKSRIGLHEGYTEENNSFIILTLMNSENRIKELKMALCEIDGVKAKTVKI